jgi:glutamate formiminotransferase
VGDLLECVPNFSEGRDQATIDAIASALGGSDVRLLDIQSDRDHNRSVFTVIGPRRPLVGSIFRAVETAVARIDLRTHEGAHPRMGAVDVVPFIPLLDTPMESAIGASRELGARIAHELDIPIYFYEETAATPDRKNLARVRGKGFEELRDLIATDTDRKPDLGPPRVHESAGATAVGARFALIAYNVYLDTSEVAIAKSIARTVRHSSGGLRYVKAMGFDIPERACVQVSMNLTNHRLTAMHTVFDMIRVAAEGYGVSVTESEVVGMIPAAALMDVARHYLRMHSFTDDQCLELRLLETA